MFTSNQTTPCDKDEETAQDRSVGGSDIVIEAASAALAGITKVLYMHLSSTRVDGQPRRL